jgi:hypothetical protein
MDTEIGYVIVSQVYSYPFRKCPNCTDISCEQPRRPGCHARCVVSPRLLEEHPDCQEWQRKMAEWTAAHTEAVHTGGTRLGPLHHFQDCKILLRRAPRREDARVIPIDSQTAALLNLPLCKECKKRMAPFEEQFLQPEYALDCAPSPTEAAPVHPSGDKSSSEEIGKKASQ